MASVTQRIANVQQPRGGYLPMRLFRKEKLDDRLVLNEKENISAALVGMAVDYLTRFMTGDEAEKAFHISLLGAEIIGESNQAKRLLAKVTGLDDRSITAACKLVGFDVCCRASSAAYKPVQEINPDAATIENIRIMVDRSLYFWDVYGPVIYSDITFEEGYTQTVGEGDGDFVTEDTLWDFKVSKTAPTSKHSLQILMYYIMGLHSTHEYLKHISNLGFFNPRLNMVYICPVSSISSEVIAEIEDQVICYRMARPREDVTDIPRRYEPPMDKEFTVTEICEHTGLKRSVVLSDIHSGVLNAYKKGNKYHISREDCIDYLERKERQRKIMVIVTWIQIIAVVILGLFMLNKFM